jgi:hypothetical protein
MPDSQIPHEVTKAVAVAPGITSSAASAVALPPPFDAIVQRLLSERPGPLEKEEVTGIRLIRTLTRPYSSCVNLDFAMSSGGWRCFMKVGRHAPTLESHEISEGDRMGREFELLMRLDSHFLGHPYLGVVKPVAFYPEFPATVTVESPGQVLLGELERGLSFWRGNRSVEPFELVFRRCGEWLREFQQATRANVDDSYSLSDMRDYVDKRLCKLARRGWLGCDELWRRSVLQAFDSLASQVPASHLGVAGVHGDFGLGNILVSRDRVVVLDFPMWLYGSVFHDVTHLDHHLVGLSLNPRFRAADIERIRAALLEGFGPGVSRDDSIYRLFQLQHIACQLSRLSTWKEPPLSRLFSRHVCRQHLKTLAALVSKLS